MLRPGLPIVTCSYAWAGFAANAIKKQMMATTIAPKYPPTPNVRITNSPN